MRKQFFILGTIICLSQAVFAVEDVRPLAHLKSYVQEMLQVDPDAIFVPNASIEQAYEIYEGLCDTYEIVFIPSTELQDLEDDNGCLLAIKHSFAMCTPQCNSYTPIMLAHYNPLDFISSMQRYSPEKLDVSKIRTILREVFKMEPIARREREQAGAGGELGVTARWGDDKGVQVDGYIKGEVHDDHGNYVEVEVKQNERGGSCDAHAGHRKE